MKVERINGLGHMAEEWADVNVRPSMRQLLVNLNQTVDNIESTFIVASRLIVAWSLRNDEGKPLPITPETVGDADAALTWPIIERIKQLPFLANLGK